MFILEATRPSYVGSARTTKVRVQAPTKLAALKEYIDYRKVHRTTDERITNVLTLKHRFGARFNGAINR